MREIGKELVLDDPFTRKPGSRPLPASGIGREPLHNAHALEAMSA